MPDLPPGTSSRAVLPRAGIRAGSRFASGRRWDPDATYREEVEAFFVRRLGTDTTEDELLAFCREHLAKHKTPHRITFMGDSPKNQVGKVLKRVLREQAVARS